MLLIKKIIFYILKMISWVFVMKKVVHRDVDIPGPKDYGVSLPKDFLCSKVQNHDSRRVYKFSVGTRSEGLIPLAVKRRGSLGRWLYLLINYLGVKTKENPYLEIAPLNDVTKRYVLDNKLLFDSLMKLFYSSTKSRFKPNWMFSVKGSLWIETDVRFISFQSLIDDAMTKIADDLSDVLDELKRIPTTHADCQQPSQLIKINGFVRGFYCCSVFEMLWMFASDYLVQTSNLIFFNHLLSDAFMVTVFITFVAILCVWIALSDRKTKFIAFKYNASKFFPAVFFTACMMLHSINSYVDTSVQTLVNGTVKWKSVSHSSKGGTSYNVEIELPQFDETVTYKSKSSHLYNVTQKGSNVYLYIHEGALGYKWWDGQYYTISPAYL